MKYFNSTFMAFAMLSASIMLTLMPVGAVAQVATPTQPTASESSTAEATTWLVIRHAEREGETDRLTPTGNQRALAVKELGELLNVAVIYSTDTVRTRETVAPLAQSLGLEIQTYQATTPTWFEEIRSEHVGKVVLIVGHSNTTGVIAGTLAGVEPFSIAHDDYSSLLVVTTSASSRSTAKATGPPIADSPINSQPSVVRLRFGASSVGATAAKADQMGPAGK